MKQYYLSYIEYITDAKKELGDLKDYNLSWDSITKYLERCTRGSKYHILVKTTKWGFPNNYWLGIVVEFQDKTAKIYFTDLDDAEIEKYYPSRWVAEEEFRKLIKEIKQKKFTLEKFRQKADWVN